MGVKCQIRTLFDRFARGPGAIGARRGIYHILMRNRIRTLSVSGDGRISMNGTKTGGLTLENDGNREIGWLNLNVVKIHKKKPEVDSIC